MINILKKNSVSQRRVIRIIAGVNRRTNTLAANVMESLLLNGICVNLIGIHCFWSYVQLRNEILLISSIHYVTKLNGQTHCQYCLGTAETQEKEKSEFRGSHLKLSLPSHYHFDAFMQRGVSVKTIDISLNFYRGSCHKKVARMLGCLNDAYAKFCDATERLADHTGGSMGVRWKSPRHGKTVNCNEWSERTTSSRLLVCECRWSADLGGGCQFEPLGDGFWPAGYWSRHCLGRTQITSKHPRRQWQHLIPQDLDIPMPVHGSIHHDQLTPPPMVAGLHPIPWLTGHDFHH